MIPALENIQINLVFYALIRIYAAHILKNVLLYVIVVAGQLTLTITLIDSSGLYPSICP